MATERSTVALPGRSRSTGTVPTGVDLGKSGRPWATPSSDFYRIDTALSVPELSSHDWQLRIHGMVDQPLTLSYAEVLKRPMIERWITLCCVSNPVGGPLVGNAYWQGIRLADLLREAGIHADSDQLLLTSSDGMTIGAPTKVVMDGRDALLAVGMNGAPLPIEHGYPARIVVPGLYGYVSACKWVVDIKATTFAAEQAYWPQGGWTSGQLETSIQLQSRIDTPRSGEPCPPGVRSRSPASPGTSTSACRRSRCRSTTARGSRPGWPGVPSTDTWRQWVLSWTPPRAGSYRVRVRAVDGSGRVQPEQRQPVFPSGATGWHTVTVQATST